MNEFFSYLFIALLTGQALLYLIQYVQTISLRIDFRSKSTPRDGKVVNAFFFFPRKFAFFIHQMKVFNNSPSLWFDRGVFSIRLFQLTNKIFPINSNFQTKKFHIKFHFPKILSKDSKQIDFSGKILLKCSLIQYVEKLNILINFSIMSQTLCKMFNAYYNYCCWRFSKIQTFMITKIKLVR